MNKVLPIAAAVILLIIVLFAVLNGSNKPIQSGILQISASFYPMYFLSSQIVGDKAEVKNITPSGSEPHDFEPTSRDISEIEKANLLVLNGEVEVWGSKIRENLKGKNVAVVVTSEGLITKELKEENEITKDPHVWLDPILFKKEGQKVKEALVKVDPQNASFYLDNEKKLDEKLDKLDSEFKNGLKICRKKDIVTSHAAFAYLAERYGLNQVSIAGLSPDEEPSAQQLANVAKFAKENNVKYIFFESLVSPKLSETIANEVGAKTLVLDPLEGISDNDQKKGANYFTVMENNLKNLQIALQCK